jgi:dedicator of cytokinesis protein 3
MLYKHPGSRLLKTMGDPPVDVRFGNDLYIQCTVVTPEPNRSLPIFTNPDVPVSVRNYYEHRRVFLCSYLFTSQKLIPTQFDSAINIFSTSRPVTKGSRDGTEEVWLEKAYFTTEETFPTVLRRSEIVGAHVLEISPIENALNEVEQKTKELTALNFKYSSLVKASQDIPTNALAMSLNTAVDAPMNTGIGSYRHIFFSPDYVTRYPERAGLVEKLKIAIDEHVRLESPFFFLDISNSERRFPSSGSCHR